jgi:DNA repair exonuclease SbcCD ATPase subunit
VESGKLRLGDEKRALQEISNNRRLRRTVEGFQAEQAAIDREKEEEEQLRAQLDDPEAKATSERYEKLKAEFDDLKRESDEAYANKNKLFDERNALQREVDELWSLKKESIQRYKTANDRYWAKAKEEQARRAEKQRQLRAAEEQQKKLDLVERLREEASSPAYQIEIQDCQTLIDAFSKGTTSEVPAVTSAAERKKVGLAGIPELDIRKVEAPADLVARKKKGEEDEAYFVAGKGKKSKRDRRRVATTHPLSLLLRLRAHSSTSPSQH